MIYLLNMVIFQFATLIYGDFWPNARVKKVSLPRDSARCDFGSF